MWESNGSDRGQTQEADKTQEKPEKSPVMVLTKARRLSVIVKKMTTETKQGFNVSIR